MTAALLCSASEPVEVAIVVASPIRIVKSLGPESHVGDEDISMDAVYLVKMKTISVPKGDFSERTFNARIVTHQYQYIKTVKEWVIVFARIKGKYEQTGAVEVRRHFCYNENAFDKSDLPPEDQYRIVYPDGSYSGTKCYDL